MNRPSAQPAGWSARRWSVTIGLIFLLQLAVAWSLSDTAPLAVREEGRPFRIRQSNAEQRDELGALLALLNPTRLVMPDDDGFSGQAWLDQPPVTHRSPGWSSPPEWLTFKSSMLLADLAAFGRTNHPARASIAEPLSRPPRLATPLDPILQPARQTRWVITGDVSRRELRATPQFPVIDHVGVIGATVIQLDVDERGRVFSETLRNASGSPAADQQALALARTLRFANRPGFVAATNNNDFGELRRATLTVHWWTRPPQPTNPPATTTNALPVVQPLP